MSFAPIVHVVDSDAASSASVRELLNAMNLRCAVHSSGEQFLEAFDPSFPGCIILEICIPEVSGLEIQRRLVDCGMTQPVIFVTRERAVSFAVRAMRCGAVHYFEKPFRENELWDAILEAVELDRKRRAAQERQRELDSRLNLLTAEERRLTDVILTGKPNREMASLLGVSLRTVELRRARVMRKLDVKSPSQLLCLLVAARTGEPSPYPGSVLARSACPDGPSTPSIWHGPVSQESPTTTSCELIPRTMPEPGN